MSNCSLVLKIDKLPKIISKLDFFIFRAAERNNISYLQLLNPTEELTGELLDSAKKIINEYIEEYKAASKYYVKTESNIEAAKEYETYASNLKLLIANWNEVISNYLKNSTIFKLKNKFKLDENGLVDMSDIADEDSDKVLKKMTFDQTAGEIDPIDEVNKAVELFLKSIPDENESDEYGFTMSINYPTFVKQLFYDLENTTSLTEIIERLEKNKDKLPAYQKIIDKISDNESLTKEELQFRINFVNSFAKAAVPINMVSVEENNKVIKVFDAVSGKRGGYLTRLKSNFTLFGLPVMKDGKMINLASYKNNTWVLTKDNLQGIKDYLTKGPESELSDRQISFLKGLGFSLSDDTIVKLKRSGYVGKSAKGKTTSFTYLTNFLETIIDYKGSVTNPIKALMENLPSELGDKSRSQKSNIDSLIDLELSTNKNFVVEKSLINAEGNRVHSLQLHNNFTVLNKYISDPVSYPTLQSIIEKEPSMFWLDPAKNPSIKNSLFLNSLFFLDVEGQPRRRVKPVGKDFVYSQTEGEFVGITINSTGGLQLKEGEFQKEGASSTGLNEIDKLLQDINAFFQKTYTSVLRLGDKSTDLGMSVNYYYDPMNPSKPVKHFVFRNRPLPLGSVSPAANVFSSDLFIENMLNAAKDTVMVKFLAGKGLLSEFTMFPKNAKNTWGYFDKIFEGTFRDRLNDKIADKTTTIETLEAMFENPAFKSQFKKAVVKYFEQYSKDFTKKFDNARREFSKKGNLFISETALGTSSNFESTINYYLANTFLVDIEQMKLFFGDALFFKEFTKRASKDSATGVFTFMDESYIKHLNNREDKSGYGANTNLSGRLLIERMYQQRLAELEKMDVTEEQKQELKNEYKDERDRALLKQQVGKSYKSAVLNDIEFESLHQTKILDSIQKISKIIPDGLRKLFDFKNPANKPLSNVIFTKYNGKESDGQGFCTFDFYRTMSILTSQWSTEQEEVYKKIVDFNHYDEMAEMATDPQERSKYIKLRDKVGYNPTEQVFFPPKKFQYSGPQFNSKTIDGQEYSMNIPVFDKFSLQPLIPTIIKGTVQEHLAKKMEYNGIGYVKFESGSKVETPAKKDNLYKNFNSKTPDKRTIKPFSIEDKFDSEQELYFNHFKEQVSIDSEIHPYVIFGSQIRKLIMMNLDKSEFQTQYDNYKKYMGELVELEKANLFNKMGITRGEDGRLMVSDFSKIVKYFFDEISRKNQNSNVRKALKYNEETGSFEIPLDAAVQSQVIEGIVISAINNNIVRYKTNGSMLIQTSITGTERVKFDKQTSKDALETFGNSELKYYEVEGEDGKYSVSKMEVKIALTGQWLNLLELEHPTDKRRIGTLPRLNEALRNEDFRKKNEKALTMIAYRIPTQGRNFLDSMIVKEFLPSAYGDAIVMPSEVVIKSGSDFDIDKMFVFYPNLTSTGEYSDATYTKEDLKNPNNYYRLKGAIQNKMFETMSDVILHPKNFVELVTPAENYHIMPLVEKMFEKLGLSKGGKREKTDYKNTDVLNREKNINKFISLLRGKRDLGIAAIANTFNVLFQTSKAKADPVYFSKNNIKTFFESANVTKDANNLITGIDYSEVYDEDGVLKSEFFSEFINAFVDVARDDYVFAVNVVTELSPVIFYMKYAGISSEKIFAFINQPAIREYTASLSTYQNKFIKGLMGGEKAREKALNSVLSKLGYYNEKGKVDRVSVNDFLDGKDFSQHFTKEKLDASIKKDKFNLNELTPEEKNVQIAMILELQNLRTQSSSMSEVQKALKFDTSPYSSVFDAYARKSLYNTVRSVGNSVLSGESIAYIKSNSVISALDVAPEIAQILSSLFPVRNDIQFNSYLLTRGNALRKNSDNKAISTDDDVEKYARTAKNDFVNFILQNYFDRSEEGVKFFKETFNTNKSINEYLKELVETDKLTTAFEKIRSNTELYSLLKKDFPFVESIVIEKGEKNKSLVSFKIVENGSNTIEKDSVISQFDEVVTLENKEYADVVKFFKDLALYSVFQSGLNTSDISYIDVAPVSLINKLYGFATNEYLKAQKGKTELEKEKLFDIFIGMFNANNPSFTDGYINNKTKDVSKRGKWYSRDVNLSWAPKVDVSKQQPAKTEVKTEVSIPQNKVAGIKSYGSVVKASPKVIEMLGEHAHSIDMIINGLRTRTTRSASEMDKYNVSVGDIVKHFGTSADETTKEVYARVTAIHYQGTPGWKGTWEKEGWSAESVNVIDRFSPGAAAVEFELVDKKETEVVKPETQEVIVDKNQEQQTSIQNFKESLGVDITMSNENILEMYQKEQLSGENLEEFLKRAFCNGKLK